MSHRDPRRADSEGRGASPHGATLTGDSAAGGGRSRPVWTAQQSLGLTVEVAGTTDALLALRPDYEHLQRLTNNGLPFALHDWHVAWCHHFLDGNEHLQARPMIHVVRDRAGTCVAVVPLIRTRRSLGPVKVTTLDLLGADPGITEIRGPLVAPGYEARAAWAVQQKLMAEGLFDWAQWRGIGGAFGEALAVGDELHWQEPLRDYLLDLPPTWELLRAQLKRNIRESLRHGYNSLKRAGLEFALRVAQSPDEVGAAVERFIRLHALRAEATGMVAHPNYFASAVSRRFLFDVCGRLAGRGAVRVFELAIGGEVAAVRVGFVAGDSLYLYYSGFDPRWSKYGVMTTTAAEAIKYAITQGFATVNLSPGTDVSKTRWGPREIALPQAAQISPSRFSRAAWAVYRRAQTPGGATPGWLARLSRRMQREWS